MGGFSTIWGSPPLPMVTIAAGSNSYPAGRHLGDGAGLRHVEPNLLPSNIIAGLNIFGTLGTHGYFDRWIPATLMLTDAHAIVPVDKTDNEPAAITSDHAVDYLEDTAELLLMPLPTFATSNAETITTVDQSDAETPAIGSEAELQQVLEAAVADDGGALTTETTAAKNATVNDMTLLPATPAVNDAYYFGSDYVFNKLLLNIGTQGVGTWTVVWEYWDGGAWQAVGDLSDGTSAFKSSTGIKTVDFTAAGWATTAVNGITKYWLRARVDSYSTITTQPKGTQAWYGIEI